MLRERSKRGMVALAARLSLDMHAR